MTRQEAKAVVAALIALRENASDAQASRGVRLYPRLRCSGALVKAGTRVNWNGQLKRAAVDLWDTGENNPDRAPDLWEDIDYREGLRIIPKTIAAGTAFALDECGWWGKVLYRSVIDANVYTPEEYPAGWEAVTL